MSKNKGQADFLKEQERISLAEEMMDLALMAKGTQKLFALINKECVFDLEKLQSQMNTLTKAERDQLEMKQLFDVVNDLTVKKKEADAIADEQKRELDRLEALERELREEAERLKQQMSQLGGEKDAEQHKLLEELQSMFETERDELMAEQEKLRKEQNKTRQRTEDRKRGRLYAKQ